MSNSQVSISKIDVKNLNKLNWEDFITYALLRK